VEGAGANSITPADAPFLAWCSSPTPRVFTYRVEVRYLSATEVRKALPMDALIDAVAEAFVAHHRGRADVPPRLAVAGEHGTTLVMGGAVEGMGRAAKVVSVFPGNAAKGAPVTNGLVVVLDETTGVPALLCHGGALTAARTGAASGAATRALARPETRLAALIGCGGQAATQLQAIDTVAALDRVFVYARDGARVRTFIERMQPTVSAELCASSSAEDAVEQAGLVCVATSSSTPVFDGEALQPGTHINAVGSFRLDMQELDGATIARSHIVVDDHDAALEESGELVAAARRGVTTPAAWVSLGSVLAGEAPGRPCANAITLFKSVGLALQDVAAGALALRNANRLGLGLVLESDEGE
jgi:ornithine cyclodeaminase